MKRIGIIGGTFNPIHVGHIWIAQAALEQMSLDKVFFVPSFLPPHRKIRALAAAVHRLAMVRLCVKGRPRFEVSDFEMKKGGKSYTIDTVQYFRKKFPPPHKLFFIIGADNMAGLRAWKAIEEIERIVDFIVVNRPGFLLPHTGKKCHMVSCPGFDVSASYIRRRIQEGKTIQYFVPDDVVRYINRFKLYEKSFSKKEE